jgi:hypothetical protein
MPVEMRTRLAFAASAALFAVAPVAIAAPPTLAAQTPIVQQEIRTGVLRFNATLHKAGMAGVIGEVANCYRANDDPGKEFPLLACIAEDDAGYAFSLGAKALRHFPPLPYYQRSTYYTRQNAVLIRSKALPPNLRTSFINTTLSLVAQEMEVVMGPPGKQ